MGKYINKGNTGFQICRNSEYVDKSGLISIVNSTLLTEMRFSCVSRSRRFGKSMAAKMLAAYYDQSCDSHSLFDDLEIAKDSSYENHLNKYPVIYIDMTGFVSQYKDKSIIDEFKRKLLSDLQSAYPNVSIDEGYDLMDFLTKVVEATCQHFILIMDEWDAILREFEDNSIKDSYVDLLRRMFKDKFSEVFAAVYMTGILPIKKYNTQSALNNFIEYSMVDPGSMAPFFGFTKDETKQLAIKYNLDFYELEKWYDGYQIGDENSMFNPNSVMQALRRRRCKSYWDKTSTFDAVADYINLNYKGLKDDIIYMLAGGHVRVNTTKFQNDMSIIRSKDDVLTVLIHLGYLSFDVIRDECFVPNKEVGDELRNAIEETNWTNVINALHQSESLLQATLDGDGEAVARGIDAAHDENTSILSYNNENSLACVISIAYYYAKNDYIIHRELTSGKGFADLVMIPRKSVDSPALLIELKCDKSAETAIDQIKQKNYPAKLEKNAGNILLVGINYDRQTKQHTCKIERA